MNRAIKFRAWDGKKMRNQFIIADNGFVSEWFEQEGVPAFYIEGRPDWVIMQFTGLKDKNGTEIYEGDIVRWCKLGIEWQTHYGDNIPMGSYTEPCGILTEKLEKPVRFIDAKFTCAELENEEGEPGPPDCPFHYKDRYDRLDLNHIFYPRPHEKENEVLSDEEFLEVAQSLVSELGFKAATIDEFIEKINGIEVIGNIYENPELI